MKTNYQYLEPLTAIYNHCQHNCSKKKEDSRNICIIKTCEFYPFQLGSMPLTKAGITLFGNDFHNGE